MFIVWRNIWIWRYAKTINLNFTNFLLLLLLFFSIDGCFDFFYSSFCRFCFVLSCSDLFVVAVPAKFISEPKRSVTAYKTWDITLKCDIFGFPSPLITWTRSRDQLPINRNVIDGNQLTIKNTKKEDGGAYVCQGANPLRNVMAVLWMVVKDVGKISLKYSILFCQSLVAFFGSKSLRL